MTNFIEQLKKNYLSIISLFMAVFALIHNTNLYVRSETNRNIRLASFEILMKLGQLQQEINMIHYNSPNYQGTLITGWGYVSLIDDLSKLIPPPVPQQANKLIEVWKKELYQIKEREESVEAISREIDATRTAVIDVITHLT